MADPIPSTTPRSSSPLVRPLAIGAAVIALAYGSYALIQYEQHGRFVQGTEDAYVEADGVTISSKLAGYVRQVGVRDNQDVHQGQFLVEIDPIDYRTRLTQADAQVAIAQAARTADVAGVAEARAALSQAQAALAASQRDLAFYTSQVARYTPLAASGAEPRQQLDQFLTNRDKAAADVRAKQAQLASAHSHIASLQAQVDQALAQIGSAKASQLAAHNDFLTTRIIAPIAGRVGSSSVRVGQYVQPGQRLMTVVPTQALYVEANFKETQIGLMRPGQPATLRVDALPGVDFHGQVESITPGTGANFSLVPPQNATGNFTKIVQRVPVRIHIQAGPESRQVLVPGLSLSVDVDTSGAAGAIAAIRAEQGNR